MVIFPLLLIVVFIKRFTGWMIGRCSPRLRLMVGIACAFRKEVGNLSSINIYYRDRLHGLNIKTDSAARLYQM